MTRPPFIVSNPQNCFLIFIITAVYDNICHRRKKIMKARGINLEQSAYCPGNTDKIFERNNIFI